MSSFYRQQLENWLKTLEIKGVSVLDIGGQQKRLGGDRLRIWEPSHYVVADVMDGADVKIDINAPKKFEEVFPFEEEKFDVVFCLEVFEYLVNPLNAVMNISDYLKDGGVAYISFPFIYPIHKPEGDDMLRYTENWIKNVLAHYGFNQIEIKTRNANTNVLEQFYKIDGMKAMDGIDHSVTGYLVKAVK